jgi:Arc/MetJ-type ribon-helix-helix transcriptional regulator
MPQLQVSLPDSIREFAGAQVASGRFPTISDYLGALVSADEQAQKTVAQLSENPRVAALLEESLNSGPGRPWSSAVLGQLKQQVLDRASGKST